MHSGGSAGEHDAPADTGRAFGALRHRDFRLFWGGALVSHIGSWMQQIAQTWLIYELTGSAFLVGLTGVFLSVPFIIMSIYAGAVVDRVDRKRLLVWIETANLAITLAVGLLVWSGHIEIWHLYASNVLHALVGAFESPARSSLLPHMVPRADLMTAISLNSVLRRGSQIIGPALGGVSIAAIGVAGTYFAHAAATLALVLSVVLIRATNPASERERASSLKAVADGLRYVRGEYILGTLIAMELATSLFGSFNAMMVVFARDVFQVGPQGLGLLQSASGAGTVVGSLVLASLGDIYHKGRLVILGGVVYGLAVAAFAFCPWFLLALPVLAITGAADIVMGATRITILQLLARREMLGRVMSLHAISTRGIGPFGSTQMGALTELIGVHSAVALGGIGCLIVAVGVAARVPGVWQFVGTGRLRSALPQGQAGAVRTDEAVAVR